jgi:hypothetical protein
MKTLIGVLIFCFFLPLSTCKADAEISYGFAHVKFFTTPLPEVKIDHSSDVKAAISLSIISTAEAAVIPDEFKVKDFEKIYNTISDAGQLDDLKPVLSDKNFELLKAKVKDGVSPYVVLAMLQAAHPQKIRIIDSRIEEGRAEFAVVGQSVWGPVQGKIQMIKVDGAWKIENESWQSGKYAEHRNALIFKDLKSLSDVNQYIYPDPVSVASSVSSDYFMQKNPLQLSKVSNNRRKRALMFVFFMDKAQVDPDRAAVKDDLRGRVHVLGPKRIFPEQQVIEDKYPLDISGAKYTDGYAAQEWNFVIPSGKPREIAVSWLWSF